MAGKIEAQSSLNELRRVKGELDAERAVLEKEIRIFRRLGFSTEQVNLRLRRLEAQRGEVTAAIRRCQADKHEKAAEYVAPP